MSEPNRCKICCAKTMYVGRWYRLITYARFNLPTNNYWAKYSCSDSNVRLFHDTVYVEKPGKFTISCVDMYGNTDSVTIDAVEEPFIERTHFYDYTVTTWDEFKSYVTECGEYAYIHIPKGEYDFLWTSDPYVVPEGTIIDFGYSTLHIETNVEPEFDEDGSVKTYAKYRGFHFTEDYTGICNVKIYGADRFYGLTLTDGWADGCESFYIWQASHVSIRNVKFKNMVGFNFSIGTWDNPWNTIKPSYKYGRWMQANNANGHISETGEVVEDGTGWCMKEMDELPTINKGSFYVGRCNYWIPTSVRLYSIAFYDANKNFISIQDDNQYFRVYSAPENAVYYRLGIYQDSEPQDAEPRDYKCIMNIYSPEYGFCHDIVIDNISMINSACGAINVIGTCNDLWMNRIMSHRNGWNYGWCIDIEDGWNGVCGAIISNSLLNSIVPVHGVQGFTALNSLLGNVLLSSNVHAPTFVNSSIYKTTLTDVRCAMTAINTTVSNIENRATDYPITPFIYGENITAEERRIMFDKVTNRRGD